MKLRKFALLLLLVLLFSALAGCEKIDLSGGNSGDDTSSSSGTSAPSGTVVTVKTLLGGSDAFLPVAGESTRTDDIIAAIRRAERETGLTVEVQTVSRESMVSDFVRLSRAGTKYADLIQADAMFLSRYYGEGYLLSLSDAGVSPSDTGTLTTVDGIAYALRADAWLNPLPTASFLLFYNEKILLDCGLESPAELYEEGVWNWTLFEALCRDVAERNPGEIFAIAEPVAGNTDLIWATLHGAGATYFDKDGVCTMDSRATLDGFAALRQLLTSGAVYRLGSYVNDTADPTAKLAFINRRTAFYVGNASEYFDTSENSLTEALREDLRIIGFPALTNGASGVTFTEDDVFFGITALADKENCNALLGALFSEKDNSALKEEIISDYFYHAQDGEIYFDLLKKADTHSALGMTDNLSMVDEFFLRVAGGGSAKEILNNLQVIFNSPTKG